MDDCGLGWKEDDVPASTGASDEIKELPWFQLVAMSACFIDTRHQLLKDKELCEPSNTSAICHDVTVRSQMSSGNIT